MYHKINPVQFGRKTSADDKMVAGCDLASELMDSLVPEPFIKTVCLLDWQKRLTVDMFRKTREVLSGSYWIDSQ